MLRTLIRLSDGREISSGVNESMNIRSCTITQCCNSGDDLTIGSVCAACVEMVVEAPDNTFRSDDVFTLYKVDDAGNRTQIGIFNVFAPEKKSDHLYNITAYDNVIKLDRDITEWFIEVLTYNTLNPAELAGMVCEECGVVLGHYPLYDSDLHVISQPQLPNGPIIGRKIIQWISEMLGYFCVATPNGELGFRWYTDKTNIVLSGSDTSKRFRMQGSYKWKNEILPIDSVMIIDANGTYGSSTFGSLGNQYIIKDNPFLIGDQLYLGKIAGHILLRLLEEKEIFECRGFGQLAACEVSVPASLDIAVGDIIVADEQDPGNQNTFKKCMRVMTKIQKGQKDTLRCVGPYRRRN